jgi:ankyrin repeat protein
MLSIDEQRTVWLRDAALGVALTSSTGDTEMVDYLMTHYTSSKNAFKCKDEDTMQVQEVSMHSPNPNYDKDSDGNMVLHIAVWSGQVRCASVMLRRMARCQPTL